MKRFGFSSLTVRLQTLVWVAIIPALLIQIGRYLDEAQELIVWKGRNMIKLQHKQTHGKFGAELAW